MIENSGVLHGNESVNTFSPSFRLDVGHLLGDSLEADHEDEVCQVFYCNECSIYHHPSLQVKFEFELLVFCKMYSLGKLYANSLPVGHQRN
jgi:hypothetical protein